MGVSIEELHPTQQDEVNIITDAIESVTGVTYQQILSKNRQRYIVDARKFLVNVLRKHVNFTCYQAGKVIDKDHTTVVHYTKVHKNHMQEPEYRRMFGAISGIFLIQKNVRDDERLQEQFKDLQRRTKTLLESLEAQEKVFTVRQSIIDTDSINSY
jgi:hypothetical protein